MFIPTQETLFEMTPTQFEQYSLEIIQEQFQGQENLCVYHNVIEKSGDGTYQIDGEVLFTIGDFNFKILVECKHYSSSITRDKVVLLADKVRTLKASKGILISTSAFQRGAIQYATEHNIALVQIIPAEQDNKFVITGKVVMNCTNCYNFGKSYIGVLQSETAGISCKYLTFLNKELLSYIIGNKGD